MKSFLLILLPIISIAQQQSSIPKSKQLIYINTSFENASQLDWTVDSSGVVQISLVYDHERNSANRANGHWHFQLQSEPGADIEIELRNFENIYNGNKAYPVSAKTNFIISDDGVNWKNVPAHLTNDKHLKATLHVNTGNLYVASVEPYRLSDLEKLKEKIKKNPSVNISTIGKTVEGRPLEMIRIGNINAPHIIFIRARAHSWEPGGNWVVQGLINTLLDKDSAEYLKAYCIYIMPMANKDGVAHGRTRFNSMGVDLNRQWDLPADPVLAPEKFAYEKWLLKMIARGKKPELAIDLHNDEGGNLHVNTPDDKNASYTKRFKLFENLLYQYTWFTEGPQVSTSVSSFGEGMAARFNIDACVLELNYEWSEGLHKVPMGKDWELFGSGLKKLFLEYFKQRN